MGNSCNGAGTMVVNDEVKSSSTDFTFSKRSDRRSVRDPEDVKLQWNKLNERRGTDEEEVYKILGQIGEGSISTISKIKKNPSVSSRKRQRNNNNFGLFPKLPSFQRGQVLYALKKVNLSSERDDNLDELRNEIDILKSLDHPNILKAFETFEKDANISIVMELCEGGDLKSRQPYTEEQSAIISSKILSAVAYMHENNIAHRDIKCENIMFESSRMDAEIKIIDFGLSKKYKASNQGMTDRVGTVYTMAPEVIEGHYSLKADVWSVGVISYILLSGRVPFPGKKRKEIENKIIKGDYNFDDIKWNNISDVAKDFVSCLIQYNPIKRLSAEEAQEHEWLQSNCRLRGRELQRSTLKQICQHLVQNSNTTEFKRLILNIIAHKMKEEEMLKIRPAFYHFDLDNDGTISYSEFVEVLSKFNYTTDQINETFHNINLNKDGKIWYTEFLAAVTESQGRINDYGLAESFDRMDCDNTGYITNENLCRVLGNRCAEKARRLVGEADLDGDGRISYTDFVYQFHSQNRHEVKPSRSQ